MVDGHYEIGMVGLGTMGRNLVLNMAEHGYRVAGYDKDPNQVEEVKSASGGMQVAATASLEEFIHLLRKPRSVMMMVPAGVVDVVIADVLPLLEPGDLLIDGGNSFFLDTDRRLHSLAEKQVDFIGVGISGGESGARHGPSMMPGGPLESYRRIQPIFEAIAAKAGGDPCVAYLGPGSAGHYVKMVHNGIEYGLMQLIAESYDLLKRGLGYNPDRLHEVYAQWNQGPLNSYLIEITARIFLVEDEAGRRLIDLILGEASQKGTGKWTAQDAMNLQVPIPTIDMAVMMRNLSDITKVRQLASRFPSKEDHRYQGDAQEFLNRLQGAMLVGMVLTYAQGFALLREASTIYQYHIDLETVARIWRGGCIIRAGLLEDIRAAFASSPDLANFVFDQHLHQVIEDHSGDLRAIITIASGLQIPVPGLMASLAYHDALHSTWLPANLIQAQRDYFGAHTYRRTDREGVFHTLWEEFEKEGK